jgi:hypothetical protein
MFGVNDDELFCNSSSSSDDEDEALDGDEVESENDADDREI